MSSKNTLRTLKDIFEGGEWFDGRLGIGFQNLLKAEAVKWIKEDIKDTPSRDKDAWALIFRWMKRFNITEEDLKEKGE